MKYYLYIHFFIVLILFLIHGCNFVNQNQKLEKNSNIAGSWKLISRIDKADSGGIVDEPILGSDPIALIIYDNFGNVSVQIMKRNRADSLVVINNQQDPDNSLAWNGYDAYFGTYILDNARHEIKHLITGSLDVKNIGKELVRNFSISGDTLQLWFNTINGGEKVTRTLTWVRAN
jgi:hypothetical protein